MECFGLPRSAGWFVVRICWEQLPDALIFAERKLGFVAPSGTTWVAHRHDNGKVAGVVLFIGPRKRDCVVHLATESPAWATRRFLREGFRAVFGSMGCERVTATALASNKVSIDLMLRLGFVIEGFLREFDGEGLVIFGMLKGECKWVE